MPPTDQTGAEKQIYINRTNIVNLEKAVDEIKIAILDLRNHYSSRPQWYVALTISTLVGITTTLATYIIITI